MSSFLSFWISFWSQRKGSFILLLFIIVSFLFFYALRLNLNQDVSQIFGDERISKVLSSSENNNIFITIKSNNPIIENDFAQDKIIDNLEKQFSSKLGFNNIDFSLYDNLRSFYNNIPFYIEKSDYDEIESRLFRIDSFLESNHKLLYSPSSAINQESIFQDPLNLLELVTKKYQTSFDMSELINESNDENDVLIVANLSNDDILEVEPIYNALQDVKEEWKNDDVDVDFFSTSFFPVVNAIQIKKDLYLTLSFTIVLILLLLLFVFRNYILPFLFVLPAIFGMIFSLSMIYWLRDGISGIAIGAGAIVFGIVIDYSFHFFSHQNYNKDNAKTIKDLYKPLCFSAFTTIMAFYALTFTSSEILNDFGWFASFGLIGSLLFVILVLPIISPTKSVSRKSKMLDKLKISLSSNLKKYILIGISLVTIFLTFKLDDVTFDANVENLNYSSYELSVAEKNILNVNPDKEKSIILVVNEEDIEQLKTKNLELFYFLENLKKEDKILRHSNLSIFNLPSLMQENKILEWRLFWDRNLEYTEDKINKFSLRNGYDDSSFNSFINLIKQDAKFISISDLQNDIGSLTFLEDDSTWIASSFLTASTNDIDAITQLLKEKDIDFIDRSSIASEMLVNIKDDFNFLLVFTGILVFLTLLLIYGRFELAIVTFIPMIISWVWILGICSLLEIKFNFVNIIISTLLFGIGDDFAIFVSDGYIRKYKTNKDLISVNMKSIFLSALTTIIALGSLFFAKHPAIHSIASVSIIGMISILIISLFFQPFLYQSLIINRTKRGLAPITLSNLTSSFFSYSIFLVGSIFLSFFSLLLSLLPFFKQLIKPLLHFIIQKMSWLIVFVAINTRKKKFDKHNLDFSQPSILIANHQSFVDILQMLMLNRKIVLVVKDWVYNSIIFGRIIRYLGFITISDGIQENITEIKKLVDHGYSIMIFPEGRRSQTDVLGRFHKGTFLISEQLGLDITPILLHGYGNAISKNDLLIKESVISYKVLPRIRLNDTRFGVGYKERTKEIKKYFQKELIKFSEERNNLDYLYGNIRANIDYKGPILEWYYKVKWRLEKHNYCYYNSLIPHNARVYDLGCGYGFLTMFLYLKSKQRKLIGIDYDSDKINIAKNYFLFRNQNHIIFLEDNIINIDLEDPDVILLNDVLHYLDSSAQEKVLQHCFNQLNDEGLILIRDGEKDNDKHVFTKITEFFSIQLFSFNKLEGKLNFLTENEIRKISSDYGFNVDTVPQSNVTSNKLFILRKL